MAGANKLILGALTAAASVHALYVNGNVTAPCDSPIYCHGDILREIELAQPFSDSKTFVDMYVSLTFSLLMLLGNL